MILNHINYKMPIYKDCTLGEIILVGGANFLTMSIIFSSITKILLGFAAIGFAIAFLLLVPITRILLGQLQKLKYSKPHAYYKQLLLKKLQNKYFFRLFFKISFLQREGKWSIRRE